MGWVVRQMATQMAGWINTVSYFCYLNQYTPPEGLQDEVVRSTEHLEETQKQPGMIAKPRQNTTERICIELLKNVYILKSITLITCFSLTF